MGVLLIVMSTVILLIVLWGLTRALSEPYHSADEVIEEATVYTACGRREEAISILREGLTRFPGNEQLRAHLHELDS